MSFEVYASTQSSSANKKEIDYDAMNKYVIETANLQEPETLIGVVVGIVDLGTQEQQDAEVAFKGSAEDEEAEIEKYPDTYFKDGIDPNTRKPTRLKCYPQKPQQSVAVAVDFPDIIIDKGQFYGNSNPQPLRMWLGGSFWIEDKGMVIARPTPLKVVNIDKDAPKPKWSFSPLHLFYKMAIGAKLIKPGEVFLPNQIDQLIGKAFQFQVQIYNKPGKGGKEYFTENIKFVGGLGRGQVAPESENTFMIQFNKPNKPEDLKQLRNHVLNTIKAAQNYDKSNIKKEIESQGSNQDTQDDSDGVDDNKASTPAPQPKQSPVKASKPPAKPIKVVEDNFDPLDDDVPF